MTRKPTELMGYTGLVPLWSIRVVAAKPRAASHRRRGPEQQQGPRPLQTGYAPLSQLTQFLDSCVVRADCPLDDRLNPRALRFGPSRAGLGPRQPHQYPSSTLLSELGVGNLAGEEDLPVLLAFLVTVASTTGKNKAVDVVRTAPCNSNDMVRVPRSRGAVEVSAAVRTRGLEVAPEFGRLLPRRRWVKQRSQ